MFNTNPNATLVPGFGTGNEEDLFDLAAKLAGCEPAYLLKVRRDPAGLVVILGTGQKFVFDVAALGEDVELGLHAQLAKVLGQELPDTAKAKAQGSKRKS